MSTEIERRPAQGPQQTPATLQLSVAAVGMGLRFVELEQTELVSPLPCCALQTKTSHRHQV